MSTPSSFPTIYQAKTVEEYRQQKSVLTSEISEIWKKRPNVDFTHMVSSIREHHENLKKVDLELPGLNSSQKNEVSQKSSDEDDDWI